MKYGVYGNIKMEIEAQIPDMLHIRHVIAYW